MRNQRETIERFTSLDLETQYQIFICASQYQHPPLLGFDYHLASEGNVAARLLAGKLAESDYDFTTEDILHVFVQMTRQNSYDVRGDTALMALLERKVRSMRNAASRARAENLLEEIRGTEQDAGRR